MSKNSDLVQCPKNGTLAETSCFILQLALIAFFSKFRSCLQQIFDLLVNSRLYCFFFNFFRSMLRSRKALTQIEILKILEELSDDDSIDDAIRDNIHVSIISLDPDKMTDEDDFDESNIDEMKM